MKPKPRGKSEMILVAAEHLLVIVETAIVGHYQALTHTGWSEEDREEITKVALGSCLSSRVKPQSLVAATNLRGLK